MPKEENDACPKCKGKGTVGSDVTPVLCDECSGSGKNKPKPK